MKNSPSSAVSAGTSRSVSQFPSFCKILLKNFSNPIVVVGENSYGKIGRFRYRQADIRACSANARVTTLHKIHELKIDENNLEQIACDPSKTNSFARSLFAKVVANAPEFAHPKGEQQLPAQKKNIESCVQSYYGFALQHPADVGFSAFSVISILAGIPESKRTRKLMGQLQSIISTNGQYNPEVVKILASIDSGQRAGFIQKASQLSKSVGEKHHIVKALNDIPAQRLTQELVDQSDKLTKKMNNGEDIAQMINILGAMKLKQRLEFMSQCSMLTQKMKKGEDIACLINILGVMKPAQRLEFMSQCHKLAHNGQHGRDISTLVSQCSQLIQYMRHEDIIDILMLVGQRPSEQVSDFVDQCTQLLSNLKIRDGLASIIVITSWSNIEPGDRERWICQAQELCQEDEQDLAKALIFQALSEVPTQDRSDTLISQCRELSKALKVRRHMPDVIHSLARMKFKSGAAKFAQLKAGCIALCKDIEDSRFKLSAMNVFMTVPHNKRKQYIADYEKKVKEIVLGVSPQTKDKAIVDYQEKVKHIALGRSPQAKDRARLLLMQVLRNRVLALQQKQRKSQVTLMA